MDVLIETALQGDSSANTEGGIWISWRNHSILTPALYTKSSFEAYGIGFRAGCLLARRVKH
jgi:hypothetical protein